MKVSGPFMVTLDEGDSPEVAAHVSTALQSLLTGAPLVLLDISKAMAQLSLAAKAMGQPAEEPEWHNPEDLGLTWYEKADGWRFLIVGECPDFDMDECVSDRSKAGCPPHNWKILDIEPEDHRPEKWTYRTKRPLPK